MSYKEQLQNNNLSLREILNTINELPEAGGGSDSSLGEKMYSFGVLSDIHLRWGTGVGSTNYNYRNGIYDFRRAIPILQNLGAEFVCISGDVGYDSKVEELSELYKPIIDELATVPFYACTGNHDWSHTDAIWQEYVGHPLNHEFIKDGDVFLFMSLVQTSSTAEQATPYSTSLTWLKERLKRYQGSRIFVFMHYPLTGYAGLRDNTYYGFSSGSTEDDELLASLIATKNVVVFSGHTHYKFAVENDYLTMNVFNFTGKEVSLVHVPSSAYPRNSSHTEEADLSEGYIVDVYENAVILRGVNLVSGVYMSPYVYELTNSNNPASSSTNAILVSNNDISLKSNESVEIEVTLAEPANLTVNIEESNVYIEVSTDTLTFTEENNTAKFTISTGNIRANGLTTITLSADGLADKTISVTLEANTVTAITGSIAPVSGTVYGGECGNYDAKYQLVTEKTDNGNYNFTFDNLKLKSSSTAIYMAGDSSTTVNLKGTNELDTSGSAIGGQRAISSSGTRGNYLIGVGEGAELTLKNLATSTSTSTAVAAVKGDWTIENAKVTVDGAVDKTSGGIVIVNSGITLRKSGEFSINGSCVKLLACENGYLEVNLGSATAGTSTITITAYPNEGYTYTGANSYTMPATGETLTIQGVFA